jgi:hypothetical protein
MQMRILATNQNQTTWQEQRVALRVPRHWQDNIHTAAALAATKNLQLCPLVDRMSEEHIFVNNLVEM